MPSDHDYVPFAERKLTRHKRIVGSWVVTAGTLALLREKPQRVQSTHNDNARDDQVHSIRAAHAVKFKSKWNKARNKESLIVAVIPVSGHIDS